MATRITKNTLVETNALLQARIAELERDGNAYRREQYAITTLSAAMDSKHEVEFTYVTKAGFKMEVAGLPLYFAGDNVVLQVVAEGEIAWKMYATRYVYALVVTERASVVAIKVGHKLITPKDSRALAFVLNAPGNHETVREVPTNWATPAAWVTIAKA